MDPRRVRLQLRIVETVMRTARPADRSAMQRRASEILDMVAIEIQSSADPELDALLARVRSQVAKPED